MTLSLFRTRCGQDGNRRSRGLCVGIVVMAMVLIALPGAARADFCCGPPPVYPLFDRPEVSPGQVLYVTVGWFNDPDVYPECKGIGVELLTGPNVGDPISRAFRSQVGVGKGSLLNAIQPGLRCATGDVSQQTGKGRHTTTTARLLPLDVGGYVVDTPGIRSLDLTTVADHELEMYFVDFLDHLPQCGFPDCLHTHETRCAVKAAVESGEIHPQRYESYVRLMEDRRAC